MNLGKHYIALAVSDINASKEFYERLGFQAVPDCGGIEQRWLMMNNGDIMVGLYQGMFPRNTLTFNPTDARAIHRDLTAAGTTFVTAANIEKESGPCHFLLTDPDGNPILIDQHF
jgi:catechol 2,3-dioxygenase-like lactoylglutathione lyase family enzyme